MAVVDFDKDHFNKEFMPSAYLVMCYITPTKQNGLHKPMVFQVGKARTYESAMKVIEEDIRSCGNTFGGLMSPIATTDRAYRIFKADWQALDSEGNVIGPD